MGEAPVVPPYHALVICWSLPGGPFLNQYSLSEFRGFGVSDGGVAGSS